MEDQNKLKTIGTEHHQLNGEAIGLPLQIPGDCVIVLRTCAKIAFISAKIAFIVTMLGVIM